MVEYEMVEHVSHAHPTPRTYLAVAGILAVATVIELLVAELFPESIAGIRVSLLLIMTVVKAGLVAAFFMHLRFDLPLYRWMFIAAVFVFALPFAIVILMLIGRLPL